MAILTAEEIRLRLRIDDDVEDADLELLALAAEDYAREFLDRPLPWTDAEGNDVPVPAAVKVAMLLLIGHLHENREAVTVGMTPSELPLGVQEHLHFYRKGLGV